MADQKNLEDDQWLSDLRWLMEDARGRRLMWAIISEAKIFHGSFSTNGSATMFNEGRRAMGLWLLRELQQEEFKDLFLRMWREQVVIENINPPAAF